VVQRLLNQVPINNIITSQGGAPRAPRGAPGDPRARGAPRHAKHEPVPRAPGAAAGARCHVQLQPREASTGRVQRPIPGRARDPEAIRQWSSPRSRSTPILRGDSCCGSRALRAQPRRNAPGSRRHGGLRSPDRRSCEPINSLFRHSAASAGGESGAGRWRWRWRWRAARQRVHGAGARARLEQFGALQRGSETRADGRRRGSTCL